MKKFLKIISLILILLISLTIIFAAMIFFRSGQIETNDIEFSLTHDNLKRAYIVHLPKGYDNTSKTPLVIALHGGGGNAKSSADYFGLNNKSDEAGFIVVYPEGTGNNVLGKIFAAWNAGRCCGSALRNDVDDVGFIAAMIDKLESDFKIDEKRIYVTGMSNGAQMAYRLACELSDKIAAIAPSGSQGTFDNCSPERPVPVLHIQGKLDPCSLYEGGTCGRCMADFWRTLGVPVQYDDWQCVSIPSYIDGWRMRNGCFNNTNISFQNNGAVCTDYKCEKDAKVILCTVEGLGHNWPGQTDYGVEACETNPDGKICTEWKNAVGPLNQDLLANDMMWEFFKNHQLID